MENNTCNFFKEFDASIGEMDRRKAAFRTLCISLFVSAGISALIFFPISLQYYLASMGIFGLFLLILALSFNRLFERSKNMKISIASQEIERKGLGKSEKCSISSVTGIRIKRTTAKQIREIRITRAGNSSFYLNGIDRFEELKDHLLLLLGNNVKIYNVREPINFDHPLFYVFFGACTGALSIIALRIMLHRRPEHFKIFQLSISCFIFFVCIYWFFTRPITGRYGQNKSILDYAIIASLILIGLALIVF